MKQDLHRRAERLVAEHVRADVTTLINNLVDECDSGFNGDLAAKAKDIAAPVLDYESAARAVGWTPEPQFPDIIIHPRHTHSCSGVGRWRVACERSGLIALRAYTHVPAHFLAVTDWLAGRLEGAGERVEHDFAGLTVWARREVSQDAGATSLLADPAILAIVGATGYRDAQGDMTAAAQAVLARGEWHDDGTFVYQLTDGADDGEGAIGQLRAATTQAERGKA